MSKFACPHPHKVKGEDTRHIIKDNWFGEHWFARYTDKIADDDSLYSYDSDCGDCNNKSFLTYTNLTWLLYLLDFKVNIKNDQE